MAKDTARVQYHRLLGSGMRLSLAAVQVNVRTELNMAEVLTPEQVLEYGMRIRELIFETGTPEERLAGLSPEERLAGLNPEERRTLLRRLQEEMDAGAVGGEDSSESS